MATKRKVVKSRTPEQLLALRRGAAYRKWRGLLTNAQQLQKDLEALGMEKGILGSMTQFYVSQILSYLAGGAHDALVRDDLKLKQRDTEDSLNEDL